MAYRRNADESRRWKAWRRANAALIAATGLPSSVTESEQAWWYYLEHSTQVPERDPYYGVAFTPEQKAALRQLVFAWPEGPDTMLGAAFAREGGSEEGDA